MFHRWHACQVPWGIKATRRMAVLTGVCGWGAGGALRDVMERAWAGDGGDSDASGSGPSVQIYHGLCAWAEGQLEGACVGVRGG